MPTFHYGDLFHEKNFRLLLFARLFNKTAMTLFQLEIIWLTMEITHQSALHLSIIVIAGTIPFIFFGLYGGSIADRYAKKKIMRYSDVAIALLMLLIPILFYLDCLTFLYLALIYFLISTCNCFLEPSFRAILPELVPTKHLQKGNALLDSIQRGVGILIPATIGLILFVTIPIHIFTICFVLFMSSAFCHFNISNPKRLQISVDKTAEQSDFKQTFSYIKSAKIILFIMFIQGITIFINTGLWRVGLPLYLEQHADKGLTTYGIITGILGATAFATSFLLGFIRKIRPLVIFIIGIFLWGAGLLLIGLSPNLLTIYVATVCIGIGQASEGLSRLLIFQKDIPHLLLGKVFSISSSINYVSDTFSLAVISSILIVLTTSNLFLLSGIGIMMSSIFGTIYLKKHELK